MPESDENDGQNDPSDSANLVSENGEEASMLSPELRDLAGKALEYHDSALSENTRKAYRRGWEDFLSFCESHGLEAAPATERAVALYLSDRAEDLATSTTMSTVNIWIEVLQLDSRIFGPESPVDRSFLLVAPFGPCGRFLAHIAQGRNARR